MGTIEFRFDYDDDIIRQTSSMAQLEWSSPRSSSFYRMTTRSALLHLKPSEHSWNKVMLKYHIRLAAYTFSPDVPYAKELSSKTSELIAVLKPDDIKSRIPTAVLWTLAALVTQYSDNIPSSCLSDG